MKILHKWPRVLQTELEKDTFKILRQKRFALRKSRNKLLTVTVGNSWGLFGERMYKACKAAQIVQFFIVFAADGIHPQSTFFITIMRRGFREKFITVMWDKLLINREPRCTIFTAMEFSYAPVYRKMPKLLTGINHLNLDNTNDFVCTFSVEC